MAVAHHVVELVVDGNILPAVKVAKQATQYPTIVGPYIAVLRGEDKNRTFRSRWHQARVADTGIQG